MKYFVAKYFVLQYGMKGRQSMAEIIVCAEPSAKKEATDFVHELGAESKLRSFHFSIDDLKHARSLLVYLRGNEPNSVLRSCLGRIRRKQNVTAVIYLALADPHQAAEWGKVVGELRPKGTYICFGRDEVRKHLKLSLEKSESAPARTHELDIRTTRHVRALRTQLALTQADVAEAVGVTGRTVQNWEAHDQIPTRRTRDLDELMRVLLDYMDKELIAEWMDSRSGAFGDRTPRELIRDGKTRDIILEFKRMQSGEPL